MKVDQEVITVHDLTDGYVDNNEKGVRGYGGRLDIRPPYQREFVYKDKQRDEVIQTAMKGFPLNSMYWAVRDDGDFEIIDGQQRTISLCQFVGKDFSVKGLFGTDKVGFFHNLTVDEQKKILDYELTVYQCSGTHREKLDWFETINIAGEKLSKQELRNAVYSGKWVTNAKGYFSKSGCGAVRIGSRYLSGAVNRQEYLETAIKWISDGDIEKYMGDHQHDESAIDLWHYFESVIKWVNKIFPKYDATMKGVDWGKLHREYGEHKFEAAILQKRVGELLKDKDVTNKKGVYAYLLSGDEKHLNLRAFDEDDKTTAYNLQGGKCKICKKPFPIENMQGDHIKPWSKGGKTEHDNLQMLCASCNQSKSDK